MIAVILIVGITVVLSTNVGVLVLDIGITDSLTDSSEKDAVEEV